MAIVRPDQVVILTDTLLMGHHPDVDDDRPTPVALVSKCIALPHLNMAVAVTGSDIRALTTVIVDAVMGATHVTGGIDGIDEILPARLRELRHLEPAWQVDDFAVSVFTFGWSNAEGCYVGRRFSNRTDPPFELFPIKAWMNPMAGTAGETCETADEALAAAAAFGFPADTIEGNLHIGCALKTISDQWRDQGDDACGIGGEIHATIMQDAMITSTTVHRFDDYDDTLAAIGAARPLFKFRDLRNLERP